MWTLQYQCNFLKWKNIYFIAHLFIPKMSFMHFMHCSSQKYFYNFYTAILYFNFIDILWISSSIYLSVLFTYQFVLKVNYCLMLTGFILCKLLFKVEKFKLPFEYFWIIYYPIHYTSRITINIIFYWHILDYIIIWYNHK